MPTSSLPAGPTPASLRPPSNEVTVWEVDPHTAGDQSHLQALLSKDELARARRFRFYADARRYVAARALLRRLLGAATGADPSALHFAYGPYGKPSLPAATAMTFNVSHAGDRILIALAAGGEVGVDVEPIRPLERRDRLVAHFFSPYEQAAFREIPPDRRTAAFFATWTRKEAFVKAHGQGLSLPLDAFDVSVDPDEPAALVAVRLPAPDAHGWTLCDVPVEPSYRAAVATRSDRPAVVRHRRWVPSEHAS